MLVSAAKMLKDAKAGKYAVGHFNINNLEWTVRRRGQIYVRFQDRHRHG